MRRAAPWIAAALFASTAILLGAAPARAESALLLPLPETFGAIEGGTFDATGHRVGEARMSVVKQADGRIELHARSGIEGSARSNASAVMELAADGKAVRLLSQRSESFDEHGASLGVLSIDHQKRIARCGAPPGSGEDATEIELAAADHVVNVPLNLLFERLVSGQTDEVSFQVLLCRFGARILDARARLASPTPSPDGLVEVRYQLDFGPLLTGVAAPFMPTLSFWFDRAHPGSWVAHRMPLFSRGPTVLVVRSGVSPASLMPDVGAGGL
jgi:hypothetical protein